jgi:hypothetical protein
LWEYGDKEVKEGVARVDEKGDEKFGKWVR